MLQGPLPGSRERPPLRAPRRVKPQSCVSREAARAELPAKHGANGASLGFVVSRGWESDHHVHPVKCRLAVIFVAAARPWFLSLEEAECLRS